MKFTIKYQEEYSRGELLLRSFLGAFYIQLPHMFVQLFLAIGLMFINLVRFWVILFTGKWPKGMFDYAVKLQRYQIRVQARMLNLSDGYPAFGLNGTDDSTGFDVEYKDSYNRVTLVVRALFGAFMIIPHIFVIMFRMIGVMFVVLIAWLAVLFTGKYPKGMHNFVVGTLRIQVRAMSYLYYLEADYPSFSGDAQPNEDFEVTRISNPDLLDDVV